MAMRWNGANLLALYRTPVAEATGSDRADTGVDGAVIGLFDEFRNSLLRYLSGFGLGMADGEEVIQETFLLLYQHLRQGKPDGNLRGWLFRVAHNLALKRRVRWRKETAIRLESGAADEARDGGPSPEEEAWLSQYRTLVLAVVRALPEQDRRCLLLRAEGLRYREIAAVLEISLGAVSISLTRTLARIARASGR